MILKAEMRVVKVGKISRLKKRLQKVRRLWEVRRRLRIGVYNAG